MSEQKRRKCNPWLGPDGTYNHRHDCIEVPDDPRHVRESAELTASTDRIRDEEEARSVRRETQREVFEALLSDYLETGEAVSDGDVGGQRYEWLQRFDAAAIRTAQLEVFVETLSELMAQWVKGKIVEMAQWKSVKDELPPVDTDVLIVVVDAENTSNRRIVLAERAGSHQNAWYAGGYFYEDYEVAHWRELPPLPVEVSK